MIFVDTSVWVESLRTARSGEAAHLRDLLDADDLALPVPVKVEILSGASRRDRPRLRRVLSALPLYYPGEATWERVDGWIDAAGDAGERFGFGDLLIGAIAAEHGGEVWTLDDDFARMAGLGFVKLHAAKG